MRRLMNRMRAGEADHVDDDHAEHGGGEQQARAQPLASAAEARYPMRWMVCWSTWQSLLVESRFAL